MSGSRTSISKTSATASTRRSFLEKVRIIRAGQALGCRSITARIAEVADLETTARQLGAIKRVRKMRCTEDLLRLALMCGPSQLSLPTTTAMAADAAIVALSDKGLLGRLRTMGDWLEHLLQRLLESQQGLVGADALQLGLVDSAERIVALYRNRWQVELGFKRLKTLGGLDKLPAMDPALARTRLLAQLIVAVMTDEIASEILSFPPSAKAVGPAPAPQLSLWRAWVLAHNTLRRAILPIPKRRTHKSAAELRKLLAEPPRRRHLQCAALRSS